jgi:hypothetical protein
MNKIIFKRTSFLASIIFLMLVSFKPAKAQDSMPILKKNEVWVNFISPGAQYKRAINSNTYLKVGLSFNFNKSKNERQYKNDDEFSYQFGDPNSSGNNQLYSNSFRLGLEKRKSIADKVSILYGPDISYGFTNWKNNTSRLEYTYISGSLVPNIIDSRAKNFSQKFAVGFSLGVMYQFNNTFGVGVCWIPEIYYYSQNISEHSSSSSSYSSSETYKEDSYGFGLYKPELNVVIKF